MLLAACELLGLLIQSMATFQISPPEKFTFSQPENWTKWIQRFLRFRSASGLAEKGEEAQVNCLIYSMGPEADVSSEN